MRLQEPHLFCPFACQLCFVSASFFGEAALETKKNTTAQVQNKKPESSEQGEDTQRRNNLSRGAREFSAPDCNQPMKTVSTIVVLTDQWSPFSSVWMFTASACLFLVEDGKSDLTFSSIHDSLPRRVKVQNIALFLAKNASGLFPSVCSSELQKWIEVSAFGSSIVWPYGLQIYP